MSKFNADCAKLEINVINQTKYFKNIVTEGDEGTATLPRAAALCRQLYHKKLSCRRETRAPLCIG